MRKPQGYAILFDAGGIHNEADSGGLCKVCMRFVCSRCVGHACDVIEKKLERWEASYHARKSYGL
jgi:hypothetical protein